MEDPNVKSPVKAAPPREEGKAARAAARRRPLADDKAAAEAGIRFIAANPTLFRVLAER